jgi:hypothetical protein
MPPTDPAPHRNAWAANRALLAQRWPALLRWLEAAPAPRTVRQVSDTPQSSLQIDGIHLGSGYDRRREARLQARLIPPTSPRAWVYGCGLGDLPALLLERPQLQELSVVLLNPAVARSSFQHVDHSVWLADPRVRLARGQDQDRVQQPFAVVPSCLELADEGAAPLRDRVVLELATPFIHQKFNETNRELEQRIRENARYAERDGDAASLFGTLAGGRIYVAAAGPTLADHFQRLRGRPQGVPLIAVDAALWPLMRAGVRPDVVVSIDRFREGILPFFRGLDGAGFGRTPLVYFPCVHGDVLDLWTGPRLTAYPEHPAYRQLASRCPKATLFTSGSVLHTAADLAVHMGANEVALLGADFSLPKAWSHVPGSPACEEVDEGSLGHWVLDGNGNRVATLPNLRGYLRDLETHIARQPGVRFLNGSHQGACIAGTEFLEGAA